MNLNDDLEKACGCIIINDGKVLLVRQNKGHWEFPKGHVEENETEMETAIREVKEETNLDVVIENDKRYIIEYVTDKGRDKQVVYFIAKCLSKDLKRQECEIQTLGWFDFDEAINTLTYENTKKLFIKVLEDLNYSI